MIHPHTALRFIDEHIGYGVVATEPIPAGTVVWALDPLDHRFSPRRARTLWPTFGAVLDTYSYVDRDGYRILCWDLARYMNHSCTANCLSPGMDFEIAVRDIAPGEQVTDDYAALNLTEDLVCRCGGANCRGRVTPADFAELSAAWDAQLALVFPKIVDVPQPLWPLVKEQARIRAVLAGEAPMPSIRSHERRQRIAAVGRRARNVA